MYKRVFLDANVIADLYDDSRPYHRYSKQSIASLVKDAEVELFTSCDVMTTLYYIFAKKDKAKAFEAVVQINTLCSVVEFSNNEITLSCSLMQSDEDYQDLEDTIQYVLAKKVKADIILSNDKGFVSKDISLMNTRGFCDAYVLL